MMILEVSCYDKNGRTKDNEEDEKNLSDFYSFYRTSYKLEFNNDEKIIYSSSNGYKSDEFDRTLFTSIRYSLNTNDFQENLDVFSKTSNMKHSSLYLDMLELSKYKEPYKTIHLSLLLSLFHISSEIESNNFDSLFCSQPSHPYYSNKFLYFIPGYYQPSNNTDLITANKFFILDYTKDFETITGLSSTRFYYIPYNYCKNTKISNREDITYWNTILSELKKINRNKKREMFKV